MIKKSRPLKKHQLVSWIRLSPIDITLQRTQLNKKLSSAGGQDDLKVTGSEGTGLTGDQTDLIGLARNSSKVQNVTPRSKGMKKKPSFAELLVKYRNIAEQQQNNQLEGNKARNSSSPREKRHQRSSHWSSSFVPSMHKLWNTYSSIPNYDLWCWCDSWLA